MAVHCWEDGPPIYHILVNHEDCEECWPTGTHQVGSSCLLLDGHEGNHDFTPDDEILLQFADTPTSASPQESR